MRQIEILNEIFPEFDKKEITNFIEFDKKLKNILNKMKEDN